MYQKFRMIIENVVEAVFEPIRCGLANLGCIRFNSESSDKASDIVFKTILATVGPKICSKMTSSSDIRYSQGAFSVRMTENC